MFCCSFDRGEELRKFLPIFARNGERKLTINGEFLLISSRPFLIACVFSLSVSGLDDLLKSGETPADRSVFDDFDSGVSSLHSRRRHHSEDSWTLSSSHTKSNGNVSHVSPSPNKSSGSSSPSQWKKELFKGDARIIEGLTDADSSSGLERTKTSVIKEMETSGHVRSSSLGSKPCTDKVILPPEKTDPLQECNHIDHLDPEEENEKNKQKVEKSSKDPDLLITFDDGGAGDSKEAANSIDQIFQSSSTVEHKTCPVETNHKDSFDSLDSEDLLRDSKKKPLSAKASGESDGSEQTGSPRSTSPSDSKESLPSAFKRTKTRQSFLSSFWNTSGLSPHVSKESISKKLFAASTQMENLGSSMKNKTIDLATKVGEYTRSFSSTSVKDNESGTKSPATGSLIDLDTLSETGDDKDSASILQDKLNTDESLEDLGIILPSFKGGSLLLVSTVCVSFCSYFSNYSTLAQHGCPVHILCLPWSCCSQVAYHPFRSRCGLPPKLVRYAGKLAQVAS